MGNDVFSQVLNPVNVANNRFQFCPLGFGFLFLGNFFVLLKFFVKLFNESSAVFIEVYFGQAALIKNLNGSAIFYRIFDIVAVDVATENLRSIDICAFNRSASETNIGCVRHGIAHVLSETVGQTFSNFILVVI